MEELAAQLADIPACRFLYEKWRWLCEHGCTVNALKDVYGWEAFDEIFTRNQVFIDAGRLAASMTMLQGLSRPLGEKESRKDLVNKLIAALSRLGPMTVLYTCLSMTHQELVESYSDEATEEAPGASAGPPAKKQRLSSA